MNKVVVNIKTDPETKEAAQTLADDLGLTLSALINAQLKQLIHHRRLVLDAPYPVMQIGGKTEKMLDEIHKEVAEGKVSQPFDSTEALFRDLKN
ncbi:hypothetical protein F4X86_01780 [Candidatus Saccharibacteria bacterium]|nr:hypothetical protein [Candidatus Saccharibacteria bacterium]